MITLATVAESVSGASTLLVSAFAWTARTGLEACGIALLVLLAQRLLGDRISARWRCNLWLLVIARLVLPAVPSRFSPFNMMSAIWEGTPRSVQVATTTTVAAVPPERVQQMPRVRVTETRAVPRGETEPVVPVRDGDGRALSSAVTRPDTPPPSPAEVGDPLETELDPVRATGSLIAGATVAPKETPPFLAPPEAVAAAPSLATDVTMSAAPVTAVLSESIAHDAAFATPLTLPKPAGHPRAFDWRFSLAAFWAAGVLAMLLHVAVEAVRLSRKLRRMPTLQDPSALANLADAAEVACARSVPCVLIAPDDCPPALVGVIRPRLLLSRAVLSSLSSGELRLVMLHELIHLKRRDVLSNWVIAAVGALHWFNPVIHLALRRMRADRELACDERVLQLCANSPATPARGGALPAAPQRYGQTLVNVLHVLSSRTPGRSPATTAAGVLDGKNFLRRRIIMIARLERSASAGAQSRRPGLPVLGCVASVLVGAVALTGPARGQAEQTPVVAAKETPAQRVALPVAEATPAPAAGEAPPIPPAGALNAAPAAAGLPASAADTHNTTPTAPPVVSVDAAPPVPPAPRPPLPATDVAPGAPAAPVAPQSPPGATPLPPSAPSPAAPQLAPPPPVPPRAGAAVIGGGGAMAAYGDAMAAGAAEPDPNKIAALEADLAAAEAKLQVAEITADYKASEAGRAGQMAKNAQISTSEFEKLRADAKIAAMQIQIAKADVLRANAMLKAAKNHPTPTSSAAVGGYPGAGRHRVGAVVPPSSPPTGPIGTPPGAVGEPPPPPASEATTTVEPQPAATASGRVIARVETPADREADDRAAEQLQKSLSLTIDGAPLKEVLEKISDDAGFTVFADWNRLAIIGISPDTQVTLRLRDPLPADQVLGLILRSAAGDQAAYAVDRGVVVIDSVDGIRRTVLTRAYDVSDLTGKETNIAKVVSDAVHAGKVSTFGEKLIVIADEPTHREVAKFLAMLRAGGDSHPAKLRKSDAGEGDDAREAQARELWEKKYVPRIVTEVDGNQRVPLNLAALQKEFKAEMEARDRAGKNEGAEDTPEARPGSAPGTPSSDARDRQPAADAAVANVDDFVERQITGAASRTGEQLKSFRRVKLDLLGLPLTTEEARFLGQDWVSAGITLACADATPAGGR